jgi:uncharacterized protein with HEPN domain
MTRSERERLADILAATDRINDAETMLAAAEDAGDEATARVAFDAVLYNLVVIGEAVNALPAAVVAADRDVPWRDIVDLRNFLAHEYFRVHSEMVRRTVDAPLARLRMAIERLAREG